MIEKNISYIRTTNHPLYPIIGTQYFDFTTPVTLIPAYKIAKQPFYMAAKYNSTKQK